MYLLGMAEISSGSSFRLRELIIIVCLLSLGAENDLPRPKTMIGPPCPQAGGVTPPGPAGDSSPPVPPPGVWPGVWRAEDEPSVASSGIGRSAS